MVTQPPLREISAVDAFHLAGITYRQLDYWARRGWVTPSIEAGTGRPGRRLYSPNDVLHLAALGHLGRSGADVGLLGPTMTNLDLPEGTADYLIVLGADQHLEVVAATDLRNRVATPGTYVVFDPGPLRRHLGLRPGAAPRSRLIEARTA